MHREMTCGGLLDELRSDFADEWPAELGPSQSPRYFLGIQ